MDSLIALVVAFLATATVVGGAHAGEASQTSLMQQAKITKAAAGKIALARVPWGTIKSAELEQEHGAQQFPRTIAFAGSAPVILQARPSQLPASPGERTRPPFP